MKMPFEQEYRQKYYKLLEEIFDSNFLSEGQAVSRFEKEFACYIGCGVFTAAISNGGMGLLALLEYIDVKGRDVIVPSNTFMATALAAKRAGANIIFADCNKYDLCISLEDIKNKVTPDTKAVILVHIGGYIAFDIYEIVEFCKEKGILLIEDCAHAHGASFKGQMAGTFGIGGVYSFYATKTMPLGEGGMIVSKNYDVIEWVKKWRNYGKFEYKVEGMNARMNEVTAALGTIQLERLPMILEWKRRLAEKYDQIFNKRVYMPEGMISGYYKYIVFEKVLETTGLVFGDLCHEIMGDKTEIPNSSWIKGNHWCPPIYYGWEHAEDDIESLKTILRG